MSDPVRRKQRIPAQTENERGKNGENRVAGERFRNDVKTAETFENKGKKKTRLPRESLWRDGLSFSKWWRCRESNPGPEQCLIQSPHSSPVLMVSWSGTAPVKAVPLARMNTRLPLRAKADGAYLREPKLKRELCHPAVFE